MGRERSDARIVGGALKRPLSNAQHQLAVFA